MALENPQLLNFRVVCEIYTSRKLHQNFFEKSFDLQPSNCTGKPLSQMYENLHPYESLCMIVYNSIICNSQNLETIQVNG